VMWLLLAAALLIPKRSARTSRPSRRMLQVVAGVASAGLCVALLPLPFGVIVGLCVGPLAAELTGRIQDRPSRAADGNSALVLVLAAAALRAGLPVATALDLARPAADTALSETLGRTAGLLRLGAAPEQAWSLLPPEEPFIGIALLARRSGHSGVKLADAFDRGAARVLAEQRSAALARAQRVSVLAVGPLGACFLPAFVCLGIVPVVVAVASGVGGQLR